MAARLTFISDAIRVKAVRLNENCQPESRKFSVDPQITSFEVLRSILMKAFDLKQDFTVFYRVLDDYDQETYLPMLSDWDLDAAFFSAVDPCLCLKIETAKLKEFGDEWDPGLNSFSWITESKIPLRLQGLIMNHVEKTVNIVRGAFHFNDETQRGQEVTELSSRIPISDAEFRRYLDPVGQLIKPEEFRNAIYMGGVEPSLRKVVWKHLLNVYPAGLSGKQRIEFMKRKSYEYEQLKSAWKNIDNSDHMKEELNYVTSMVKKDVLRTDRHHHFYAGNDDNQNIVSLFNILTTFALNHPSVSYCQGMSDLASPLLVTMGNEAHAYICFCSLMLRLSSNFLLDGVAMTQRFQHLSEGLFYYDPSFYAFLKNRQADDLLFCYRWLLLEMKREFAFDDALRMLEVMWSSLPPNSPPDDLPLYELRFTANSPCPPSSSPTIRESPFMKVCALRRQTFCGGRIRLKNANSLDESTITHSKFRCDMMSKKYKSLDDETLVGKHRRKPIIRSKSVSLNISVSRSCESESSLNSKTNADEVDSYIQNREGKVVKNLNEFLTLEKKRTMKSTRTKKGHDPETPSEPSTSSSSTSTSSPDDSSEYRSMTTSMTQKLSRDLANLESRVFATYLDDTAVKKDDAIDASSNNEEVFYWENPCLLNDTFSESVSSVSINTSSRLEKSLSESSANNKVRCGSSSGDNSSSPLPEPALFGGGNPFLIFLCISVLCLHRDTIMKNNLDYNEIAMHFDKMVRKHNVVRVLNHARILYASYLKTQKKNYLKV